MNIADIETLAKKLKKSFLIPLLLKIILLIFNKELFVVIHFKCQLRK